MSTELSSNLLNKDTSTFWKNWNSLNGNTRSFSSMIDGCINHKDIADRFANVYQSVYKRSTSDDNLRNQFDSRYANYYQSQCNESLESNLFSWVDMLDAVFSLKVGKATSTFIKAEHIFNGCPELLCYLHLLFNSLLSHSYLPHEFLLGNITTIIKDSNGAL